MQLTIVDTETSGLDPENSGVCDLGWLIIDEQLNVLDEFETLVDPETSISPAASAEHHITDDMVASAPTLEEIFSFIFEGKMRGVLLIGHNIQFDKRFLEPHIEIVDTFCTLRAARKVYPNAENHKLQTLRYMLGIKTPGQAHRALADVYVTYGLLHCMMRDSGLDLWGLKEFTETPVIYEKMPFGKHKGLPMSQVPKSYIRWLRTCDNLDPDMVYTLENLR